MEASSRGSRQNCATLIGRRSVSAGKIMSLLVELACSSISADGHVSSRPEALLARHEALAHIVESSEVPESSHAPKVVGIKRELTPDSVMTASWRHVEVNPKNV